MCNNLYWFPGSRRRMRTKLFTLHRYKTASTQGGLLTRESALTGWKELEEAHSDRGIHSLAVPAIVPAIVSAQHKILARLQYRLYME